jgi:dTDP-glucose 4,6-dehydratase
MNLLVCGGTGFIGSNFIRYILQTYPKYTVVNYDKLTYAGNPDNVKDVAENPDYGKRYAFVQGDIIDRDLLLKTIRKYNIDRIINFAAETHVDRSIFGDCSEFTTTNTFGVLTILNIMRDFGKELGLKQFIQISTDEVYGTLQLGEKRKFTEDSPFVPNMPYAAAKAGGDLLCRSYFATHKVPVIVTHCSNNYGPFQYPEKLIPAFVFRLIKDHPIFIHGDGLNVRDWIHVNDHSRALDLLMHKGVAGEVYNIGAENERNNLEVAHLILKIMEKPKSMIKFVEDRPGNDRRYAIDSTKIMKLGWKPLYTSEKFEDGMKESIVWYLANEEWVKNSWEKHVSAYKINHTPALRKEEKADLKIFLSSITHGSAKK